MTLRSWEGAEELITQGIRAPRGALQTRRPEASDVGATPASGDQSGCPGTSHSLWHPQFSLFLKWHLILRPSISLILQPTAFVTYCLQAPLCVKHHCVLNTIVCFKILIHLIKKADTYTQRRNTHTQTPSAGSHLRCPQHLGLGKAEARRLVWASHVDGRGPSL